MITQYFGLYRGTVVDTEDPDNRKRLKVRIPAVFGEETTWSLPCIPPGLKQMPKVGDAVWVAFEAGDPSYPVWMGTLNC